MGHDATCVRRVSPFLEIPSRERKKKRETVCVYNQIKLFLKKKEEILDETDVFNFVLVLFFFFSFISSVYYMCTNLFKADTFPSPPVSFFFSYLKRRTCLHGFQKRVTPVLGKERINK